MCTDSARLDPTLPKYLEEDVFGRAVVTLEPQIGALGMVALGFNRVITLLGRGDFRPTPRRESGASCCPAHSFLVPCLIRTFLLMSGA